MIPGVTTFHPRSAWELPGQSIASRTPPPQYPKRITQPVAHYTAADNLIDGDPGESADDLPGYIAAIQRHYIMTRKYSVGYLFAIDWLGGVWELRGFDYQSAANFGHNEYTAPILFLVDGDDPATELAATSARAVWSEFRRRSGRSDFATRPLGHGELFLTTGSGSQTSCPGAGILGQLHRGVFDLDWSTMKALSTPERAYDSRSSFWRDVHPTLAHANASVPKGKFGAGETRRIVVGMCVEAFVHVTAVGPDPGWVKVSGTPEVPTAALVNRDRDGVASGGAPVGTPEGAVYVTSQKAGADIVVDVFARG